MEQIVKAQVGYWALRERMKAFMADERGEANVFAIIIGIIVVALVFAIIVGMLVFGANTVDNTGRDCIADPAACEIRTG